MEWRIQTQHRRRVAASFNVWRSKTEQNGFELTDKRSSGQSNQKGAPQCPPMFPSSSFRRFCRTKRGLSEWANGKKNDEWGGARSPLHRQLQRNLVLGDGSLRSVKSVVHFAVWAIECLGINTFAQKYTSLNVYRDGEHRPVSVITD